LASTGRFKLNPTVKDESSPTVEIESARTIVGEDKAANWVAVTVREVDCSTIYNPVDS
jgi:hypothetical protein